MSVLPHIFKAQFRKPPCALVASQPWAELNVMRHENPASLWPQLPRKPLKPSPNKLIWNMEEHSARINEIIHDRVPKLAEIHILPSHNHRPLVQQPLRRQFIPESSHEGQLVPLQAVEPPRLKIPDEVQTDTKRTASDFKNLLRGRQRRGVSKELEDVTATGPGLAVVAVVLFHKELAGARQRSVVGCLFFRIVGDPMVPTQWEIATLRMSTPRTHEWQNKRALAIGVIQKRRFRTTKCRCRRRHTCWCRRAAARGCGGWCPCVGGARHRGRRRRRGGGGSWTRAGPWARRRPRGRWWRARGRRWRWWWWRWWWCGWRGASRRRGARRRRRKRPRMGRARGGRGRRAARRRRAAAAAPARWEAAAAPTRRRSTAAPSAAEGERGRLRVDRKIGISSCDLVWFHRSCPPTTVPRPRTRGLFENF